MSHRRYAALEPRLLLDAAALTTLAETASTDFDATPDNPDTDATNLSPFSSRAEQDLRAILDYFAQAPESAPPALGHAQAEDPLPTHDAGGQGLVQDLVQDFVQDLAQDQDPVGSPMAQLLLIDPRVGETEQILAHLPAEIEPLVLDPNRDGLAQLTEALVGRQDLTAIHILSHGEPGTFHLPGQAVNLDTLAEQAEHWRHIGQALGPDGDILIYGCDVAGNESGQSLLAELAALTGADVAASDDPTGAEAKGGDWELEYATGSIEAEALTMAGYEHLLEATAIEDANSDTDRVTQEDVPLTIEGISITDADNPDNMTVQVKTTGGTSSVTLNGATVSAGSNDSEDFTLSGTLTQINNTLTSLTFTNELNQNSSTTDYTAKIDLTATDLTNSVSNTLAISNISVTAVNNAPDLSTQASLHCH